MNLSLEKSKELINALKEKNRIYRNILDFYEEILEATKAEKPVLVIQAETKDAISNVQLREGFPLMERKDFLIDIPSAARVFESICRIGKKTTERMRANIQAVEEAIAINALNLKELLRKHYDEGYLNDIAREFDVEEPVLRFLIYASIRPSLEANAEKLSQGVDLKNWLRGYCPVCGSPPLMSQLKGDGQRFYLCSFCGFEWQSERLRCPFCETGDHEKLHYFSEEGRNACRVDLCDNCRQYIKTVDSRKLDYEPDLILEDVVTIHLDILASEKGYKRPAPSMWGL